MSETSRPLPVFDAWKWWAGFLMVGAGGAALSLIAYLWGLPASLIGNGGDKVVHFTLGGLLAFFLDGALRRRMLLRVPLAAVVILVPAGIEEWAQRFSSHRSSSIWDYAADCAGVFVFIALSRRSARVAQ